MSQNKQEKFGVLIGVSLALASMVLFLRWQQFQEFDFR
jgi:hypothetical protein